MVDLTADALALIRLYGPLALALFTFLETSMLFPLLPSEVVVPAAAALLITDVPSFLLFVSAAGVGGTVGAFVPYYVFRDTKIGRSHWLGNRVRISEERLESAQRWFREWGRSSVLWGRLLPVLRSAVSIPAGFANMQPARFGAYTAIGTVGFYAASGALVYYARQQALFTAILGYVTERVAIVAGVVFLVVGALVVLHLRTRS